MRYNRGIKAFCSITENRSTVCTIYAIPFCMRLRPLFFHSPVWVCVQVKLCEKCFILYFLVPEKPHKRHFRPLFLFHFIIYLSVPKTTAADDDNIDDMSTTTTNTHFFFLFFFSLVFLHGFSFFSSFWLHLTYNTYYLSCVCVCAWLGSSYLL